MTDSPFDPTFWARLVGIVIIDLTLAGDNALVIALAVRRLPAHQQFWGRVWGTLGAVALRLAFIVVATWLLRLPFLQLVGGLLLIGIAFKLVRHAEDHEEGVRSGRSLAPCRCPRPARAPCGGPTALPARRAFPARLVPRSPACRG